MKLVRRPGIALVSLVGTFGILLGGMLFFSTRPANAAEVFNAENIISDSVFTNKDSMSVAQIQSFLDGKGSTCLRNFKTLSLVDSDGNGLGDEPYGKGVNEQVSVATVIWQAAQIYRINPQVILATLQKEQGLVTRTDCPDWRYNTALGYGCPDSEPCDVAAYGFTRQIDYGVWHFRGFFDDTYPVPPTVPGTKFIAYNPVGSCGGKTITIRNRATAALYSYTPYQPNDATLAAAPGQIVDCGAYGNINFWRYFNQWFGSTQYEEPLINYKSHIGYYGWTDINTNRGVTGFTGQSMAMEAFKINGPVEYSSYNFDTGWQPTVNNGMVSGTTNQNKPIQAIKINPTDSLATKYDIYYRAHVSYVGWMGWAKNGEAAGVTGGSGKNIEAFDIQLVSKGDPAPGSTSNAYQNVATITNPAPLTLSVTSHVGMVGWQPTVTDGMVSGTTEKSRRIEALKINLNNNTGLTGGISYQAHVGWMGWQDIKSNNDTAGTVGQFKQMEAVRIALTGQLAENYDIWYRGYVQYIGWLGWAKNGNPAGSVGAGSQLEAIEVRLTPKNASSITQGGGLYNPRGYATPDNYTLGYSSQVSYTGWMNSVLQNAVSGTIGQSRQVEALRIDNSNSFLGDVTITCGAYVKGSGWMEGITNGNTCGTVGQTKPLTGLKLSLSGAAANKYDIYYRTHLSWLGWQSWSKNNEISGLPTSNDSPIEAVMIKLVQK